MNLNTRNNFVKLMVGIFILLIIDMNSYSLIIANRLEEGFGTTGEKNTSLEFSIKEGAGFFLNGNSDFLLLLNRVEIADDPVNVDYDELKTILNRAVESMEKARETYASLNQTANNTPYNPAVIEKLVSFDYGKFRSERGVNNDVFDGVVQFMEKGDVRGIFARMLKNTENILIMMYSLKETVGANRFPVLSTLWKLNQTFSETMMAGQYAAEIMYAINE